MCPIKPLAIHLVRGAIGALLTIAAFTIANSSPIVALLVGAGALAALRGCPACWIARLFEMISIKSVRPGSVTNPDLSVHDFTDAVNSNGWPVETGQSRPVSVRPFDRRIL